MHRSGLGTKALYLDPYPIDHRSREEAPVYRCANWNRWLVTRADDVQAIMRENCCSVQTSS